MKWLFLLLYAAKLAFFSPNLIAQVLFLSKPTTAETLRVSHFNETVRFTKPINKFPLDVKTATNEELNPIKYPRSITTKGDGSNDLSRGSNLAGADRWRNVPSIPPLRVLSRKQYRISSLYGIRCHPVTGKRHLHNGVDFPQPAGTPIYATADGYVRHVGLKPDGLGLSVQIEHSSGYVTTYGHLSRYEVQPGQWVRRGQQIGRVGQTGTATGPHLHYIVQFRGRNVDPMRYCFLAVDHR